MLDIHILISEQILTANGAGRPEIGTVWTDRRPLINRLGGNIGIFSTVIPRQRRTVVSSMESLVRELATVTG